MADALDSGSSGRKPVRVRLPPSALKPIKEAESMGLQKLITTYIPQGIFIITSNAEGKINGMTAACVQGDKKRRLELRKNLTFILSYIKFVLNEHRPKKSFF